jgi:lipid-binding SYLF domain-containing protein
MSIRRHSPPAGQARDWRALTWSNAASPASGYRREVIHSRKDVWRLAVSPLRFEQAARRRVLAGAAALAVVALAPVPVLAASAAKLDAAADEALARLYESSPKARDLGARSAGVLIFPRVKKAGFVVGGQRGDGVLKVKGEVEGYYSISAVSYGLQAGAQSFSYVLFFVSRSALKYLEKSQGWQIGSGPSVVVIDQGKAKSMSTTTLTQDVYVMIYGQKGLMAGMGLEGSKITQIHPEP